MVWGAAEDEDDSPLAFFFFEVLGSPACIGGFETAAADMVRDIKVWKDVFAYGEMRRVALSNYTVFRKYGLFVV